jgi:hypothetical protein
VGRKGMCDGGDVFTEVNRKDAPKRKRATSIQQAIAAIRKVRNRESVSRSGMRVH